MGSIYRKDAILSHSWLLENKIGVFPYHKALALDASNLRLLYGIKHKEKKLPERVPICTARMKKMGLAKKRRKQKATAERRRMSRRMPTNKMREKAAVASWMNLGTTTPSSQMHQQTDATTARQRAQNIPERTKPPTRQRRRCIIALT